MAVIREDLLPQSKKGQRIRTEIRYRIDMAWRQISQNFNIWDDVEDHYRAFRPTDESDRESLIKHGVQKIIVPIQFATIQTIVTFLMEVFTGLKPVLKVRGADPASVRPSRVMELLLDYDYRGNRGYLQFYSWFLNMGRYGYGILENSWGKTLVTKRIARPGPSSKILLENQEFSIPGPLEVVRDYFTTFEGNKWQVIDNRTFYPDPRWPLTRFQEGEFCARRTIIHDNELKKLEDQGIFFNTTRIETYGGQVVGGGYTRDSETGDPGSHRDRISPEGAFQREYLDARKNRVHVDEQIIIEIVPKQWELGDREEPEDWIFNIIDGTTIVRAEPSPFMPRFPYAVCESWPDILAYMSQGIMELTEPLAAHMNFLFNSHMANVRKAINDMFVVDPSHVDLRDLLDPAAGKLIRLLPNAYGTDPAQYIKQLAVQDVTQGHIQDSKLVLDLWNRILGTSDTMFGQVSHSKRTATDVQSAMKFSGSRMKLMADLASSEGVAPLTEMMALSRQENMTTAQFMELAGRSAQDLGVSPEEIVEGFVRLRRDHINGVFLYPAEEGVMPQDRANAAALMEKMFESVAKFPFLQQIFDPVEIFKETVRQNGMHNLDDFVQKGVRAQTQILPNDQVREMAQRGQVQPLEGRPDQGVREDAEGLTMSGYVNGSGRTRPAA